MQGGREVKLTPTEFALLELFATHGLRKEAVHVTRLKMESTRVVPNPMEPRACLVAWEPKDETYTVHVCVQGVNMMKRQLAAYTQMAEDRFRVIARDVLPGAEPARGAGERT